MLWVKITATNFEAINTRVKPWITYRLRTHYIITVRNKICRFLQHTFGGLHGFFLPLSNKDSSSCDGSHCWQVFQTAISQPVAAWKTACVVKFGSPVGDCDKSAQRTSMGTVVKQIEWLSLFLQGHGKSNDWSVLNFKKCVYFLRQNTLYKLREKLVCII